MVDLTGKTIKNRYFIVEKAASGGGGKLYLARDMELGCVWAVKEIPLSRRQEARILCRMQHPALPRMIDYAELEECCCLIMEYVRGRSLAACLKDGERFGYRKVLELAEEAASALEYLHTMKPPVCHADVKPENLMYTPEGKIKLVDFGSAAFSSEMPRSRAEGTPGYAPPEQTQGYLTCQGDIYALGRTLRETLGKAALFLHPDFAWFIRTCTRTERKDRYKTITEVLLAVQRLKQHQKLMPLILSGAAGALFLLGVLFFVIPARLPSGDFEKELAMATGRLYGLEEEPSRSEMEKNCEETEKEIQGLLKKYTGEEEQTKMLLILAANSELAGNPQRAALYYEQILLYHPRQEQAYASYGLFLLRQGQHEQSQELWEDYTEEAAGNEQKAGLPKTHEGQLWRKRLNMLKTKTGSARVMSENREGDEDH